MMTKELKQEAKEWIAKNSREFITNPKYSPFDYAEGIYLAGAEPREKCIAELEKENAELIGKIAFLENDLNNAKAQIEKMKCCGNCAKRGHICVAEEMQGKLCGKNKDKWELRR